MRDWSMPNWASAAVAPLVAMLVPTAALACGRDFVNADRRALADASGIEATSSGTVFSIDSTRFATR
jgi:hypothetical protein